MPGKELLDFIREPAWSVSRDELVQHLALAMKSRGHFPPMLRDPLQRIGFLPA